MKYPVPECVFVIVIEASAQRRVVSFVVSFFVSSGFFTVASVGWCGALGGVVPPSSISSVANKFNDENEHTSKISTFTHQTQHVAHNTCICNNSHTTISGSRFVKLRRVKPTHCKHTQQPTTNQHKQQTVLQRHAPT